MRAKHESQTNSKHYELRPKRTALSVITKQKKIMNTFFAAKKKK